MKTETPKKNLKGKERMKMLEITVGIQITDIQLTITCPILNHGQNSGQLLTGI